MKIAIVVQGRFYAFDLARALARKHDVTVFTNYPGWACKRFGLAPRMVRSFWQHGVLERAAQQLSGRLKLPFPEAALHRLFGRWAAREVAKEQWDVIHVFSGVAEELLREPKCASALRTLKRASSHIRTQARLLRDEETRAGIPLSRPSSWIIAREEREYELADQVIVISNFARASFLEEGYPPERLNTLPLGADLTCFRPHSDVVAARCDRIRSGQPLRVLFVGAVSFRKGAQDLAAILRHRESRRFEFRVVGAVSAEARSWVRELGAAAQFVGKQPQAELPKSYAWGDLFIFPTIEDGYAVVLAQAAAGALPILTTTNSSGPDLIREGESGWVLPVRCPEAFLERLHWCDTHRDQLARMVGNIYTRFQPRTWADVAADFETICAQRLAARATAAQLV